MEAALLRYNVSKHIEMIDTGLHLIQAITKSVTTKLPNDYDYLKWNSMRS